MQKTLPAVLTPQEFAQLLQVGIKSARAIMRELPHLNCEQRLNGQYRTLRITREVAEAFLRGELTRLPALPTATSLQMKREYERQLAELGALCLTAPTCISTIGLQEAWEKRLDDIARVNHAAPATMIWANEVGVERNQC